MISIQYLDSAYLQCECEDSIARELYEHFTFDVPNARFNPKFRSKVWDGKIRLYNLRNNTIFAGLKDRIKEFALERNYEFVDHEAATTEFSIVEAKKFISDLKLPMEVREYQLKAFVSAIRHKRRVLVSPTASGKSLIAYMITAWFKAKTLIIVPTISLVQQMVSDFESYGCPVAMHSIIGGSDKTVDAMITVSTWQSIYDMPASFFDDYVLVIGDEAHLFKAKSLISIMSKMTYTPYRIGMTGTLDGSNVHQLVLEGLFGSVDNITTSSELMNSGHIARLKIKVITIQHNPAVYKPILGSGYEYNDEFEYLISSHERNQFIVNLTKSLKGNTLLLFSRVEKHGKILFDMLDGENCAYIFGGTDSEDREEIRTRAENSTNLKIVASYGVFSTGVSIKNLHNIIFTSPFKSRIRTLQSIGRGLRLHDSKDVCRLFDIADDLVIGNTLNYTLKHMVERIKYYNEEKFDYEMHTIRLNYGVK